MTFRFRQRPTVSAVSSKCSPSLAFALSWLTIAFLAPPLDAQAAPWPVTPQQRSAAQQAASAGVPLSELAPNAPDSYSVKRGDTLWAISKLFLKSPWHWPELWGMNLSQIQNPHLIFPGQRLVLEKSGGMARLKVGKDLGISETVKLSPTTRSEPSDTEAITSIPIHLVAPFLNEALVFESNELANAPRIVATQEDRVLLGQGDKAYIRGELGDVRDWQIFREPRPLLDPETKELLGFEARYVGTAERLQDGEARPGAQSTQEVPSTIRITSVREDASVGDRLMPPVARDLSPYTPHPPLGELNGTIVSLYGDALSGGTNQIVALNRGARDGMERGHILALWHAGQVTRDKTDTDTKTLVKLPDEKTGLLFVFRVFDRVSYALIVQSTEPAVRGDRFSAP